MGSYGASLFPCAPLRHGPWPMIYRLCPRNPLALGQPKPRRFHSSVEFRSRHQCRSSVVLAPRDSASGGRGTQVSMPLLARSAEQQKAVAQAQPSPGSRAASGSDKYVTVMLNQTIEDTGSGTGDRIDIWTLSSWLRRLCTSWRPSQRVARPAIEQVSAPRSSWPSIVQEMSALRRSGTGTTSNLSQTNSSGWLLSPRGDNAQYGSLLLPQGGLHPQRHSWTAIQRSSPKYSST